jgi:hypothetical protein
MNRVIRVAAAVLCLGLPGLAAPAVADPATVPATMISQAFDVVGVMPDASPSLREKLVSSRGDRLLINAASSPGRTTTIELRTEEGVSTLVRTTVPVAR